MAKELEFAEEGATMERVTFAQLPKHTDVEDEDQRRSLGEVRNFYSHLEWQKVDEDGRPWLVTHKDEDTADCKWL